jgi:hypothetical protein
MRSYLALLILLTHPLIHVVWIVAGRSGII